ncbi:MAG: hypothetical protein ACTMIR_07295, partial [Cellulomonadaceae bacterium]
MAAGLLVAAVAGLDGLVQQAATHAFGWRQPAIVLGALLVALVPAGALARSVHVQDLAAATGPGLHVTGEVLPAVAEQVQDPPRQARVLVLDVGAQVTYQVMRADGPQLEDSSALLAAEALVADPAPADQDPDTALAELVGSLVAGVDPESFVDLGIGGVLVAPGTDAQARAQVVNWLDTIPSLEQVAESESGVFWRVAVTDDAEGTFQPAWARLTTGEAPGTALASDSMRVDAQTDVGTVVLAERADAGWHATVDGRALRVVDHGWQQAFEVPAVGRLEVWHEARHEPWWGAGVVALAAVYALLAVPVRRRVGGR